MIKKNKTQPSLKLRRAKKKILLRLDLNVPIDRNTETLLETEKIDKVISEIKKLAEKNKVIILTHIGTGEERDSIQPIEKYLRSRLPEKINQNVSILENVRWQSGETAKENSLEFNNTARFFADMGDEYIDDAFASIHRPHASIIGIPKIFKKEKKRVSLGELVKLEIKHLNRALAKIKHPTPSGHPSKRGESKTLMIFSGAKISSKLPLIIKFLKLKVKIFVSGGLANQIMKDVLDYNIGLSFFEPDFNLSLKDKNILKENILKGTLILPADVLLVNDEEKYIESLHLRDRIVDLGRQSIQNLKLEITNSQNIIMNGPLGIYEEGFTFSTKEILEFLKFYALKNKKVLVTIGGGDTLVMLKRLNIRNTDNLFISTGGGAMMEYLLNEGELIGIKQVTRGK